MLNFLDKLADWMPGRKESLLNRRDQLKRELYALQNKQGSFSVSDAKRYDNITNELCKIETRLDRIK